MAVQPASVSLSRYLTEKPQSVANREACKRAVYTVAALISAIAAVAITGGITAIFLGLVAETALSGWAILGALAAFCAAMMSANLFFSWRQDANAASIIHQKYANQLDEIKGQNEVYVKNFFRSQGIDLNKYTPQHMELLKAKEPRAPLKALLPLIARCQVEMNLVTESEKTAKAQIEGMNSRKLPQEVRDMHKNKRELNTALAILSKIRAAFYLQCLKDPSLRPFKSINLNELGQTYEKSKFSMISNTLYNLFWYWRPNPTVDAKTQSPREIRRILFG